MDENKESDDLSDDERFTKENFSKFNFPTQNSQSFTVIIQKELANHWEEAWSETQGKPKVFTNEVGTVIDTFWQFKYEVNGVNTIDMTVHIYKNNLNPNSKKVSKLLVQGSNMFILYTDMQIWLPM